MRKNILIAGAGQLGSRYLQGLASVSLPLDIWVCDISPESLTHAERRWQEVSGDKTGHAVHFSLVLENVPDFLDVVIVSTTAAVRLDVVTLIARMFDVQFWILEKVLAQNYSDILEIMNLTNPSNGAWVNTPRHTWSLYKNIRMQYDQYHPINASFEGFRGLACNSIHFISFVSRWNNSKPVSIDTSFLATQWHPAERPALWEIFGSLFIDFSDGSKLKLSSIEHDRNYRVKLQILYDEWRVYESEGRAQLNNNKEIKGECEFQSRLTAPLVESLLLNGTCNLPTLKESAVQHHIYLDSMITHWNRHMTNQCDRLPIT